MTAIKESSDELNPALAVPAGELATRSKRTATDYLALILATCGVGYLPIAPGTLGALLGVAIFLSCYSVLLRILPGPFWTESNLNDPFKFVGGIQSSAMVRFTLLLILVAIVSLVGVWAASRAERISQKKDPSIVVIDEVAGQMVALLSMPFWLATWWSVLSAFLLFRLFDIWKPYPVRRLEALESGLGIMADDVLAGIYALIANSIVISTYLLFAGR